MQPEPGAFRGGVLRGWRAVASGTSWLISARTPTPPFVRLNHPRSIHADVENDGYFSHLSLVGEPFDPTRPLSAPPNRVLVETSPTHGGADLDLHGIELMNGSNLMRYRRVRADWLSLLLQGERITANANSDSHTAGDRPSLGPMWRAKTTR